MVPPDRYRRVRPGGISFDRGWLRSICRLGGRQTRRHQRIQIPHCCLSIAAEICRPYHFLFAFHVESLTADTADTSAAARSARQILLPRSSPDKKPKVLESVGTYPRIARNIRKWIETHQPRPTSWLSVWRYLTLSDAARPFSALNSGARALSYIQSGDDSGRSTDTCKPASLLRSASDVLLRPPPAIQHPHQHFGDPNGRLGPPHVISHL